MKKILFKSEELTIVADSESKVLYGNTTRKSAVDYLANLTPQSSEDAMGILRLIILITEGKYIAAKEIKATTTTTTVVTAKTAEPSMVKTAEGALRIASKFGLEAEVQRELDNGATPLDTLREWDVIQYCFSSSES